jgi:hypothetical protein
MKPVDWLGPVAVSGSFRSVRCHVGGRRGTALSGRPRGRGHRSRLISARYSDGIGRFQRALWAATHSCGDGRERHSDRLAVRRASFNASIAIATAQAMGSPTHSRSGWWEITITWANSGWSPHASGNSHCRYLNTGGPGAWCAWRRAVHWRRKRGGSSLTP